MHTPSRRALRHTTTLAAALAVLPLVTGSAAAAPNLSDTVPQQVDQVAAVTGVLRSGAVTVAAAATAPLLRVRVPAGKLEHLITGDGSTEYQTRGTVYRPTGAVTAPPNINARSWVVMDLDTGKMLGKHNARRKLPQASTIKLLTALTALDTVPRGTRHRATRAEVDQTCTCAGIRAGQLYSRRSLLAGMLLPSGNDAAETLAGSHPRGRAAFIAAMNQTARRLGATDTVARNASGLTYPGSHSSSRDLLILLRAALERPELVKLLGKESALVRPIGGTAHRVWHGTDYVRSYPGSLGKSGYTTPALNTLVVATEVDGVRLGVATMGAPGGYSTSGTRALAEWAAANHAALGGVGLLTPTLPLTAP